LTKLSLSPSLAGAYGTSQRVFLQRPRNACPSAHKDFNDMKIERIIKLTGALMLMLVTVVSLVPIAWAAPPCGPGTFGRRFVLFDRGTTVCDNLSGVQWERTPLYMQRTFAGLPRVG